MDTCLFSQPTTPAKARVREGWRRRRRRLVPRELPTGGTMLHVILGNGSNTTRYGKLRMEGPNLPKSCPKNGPNVTRSRRGVSFGDKLRKMNCYVVLFCEQKRWQRIGAVMMMVRFRFRVYRERGWRLARGATHFHFSEIFSFSVLGT